jgi:multidrug efflux system membrane fusion protein
MTQPAVPQAPRTERTEKAPAGERWQPGPSGNEPGPSKSTWYRKVILGVIGLVLVALVVRWLSGKEGRSSGQAPGDSPDARSVAVAVSPVDKRDVPVYLEGLGNAVPLATVTVKSQVDGRLDTILFQEGQLVKKGDVLAQIDPRPFLIQLHQAEAALARDTAQNDNAKVNLDRYIKLAEQKLVAQQQADDQRATVNQNEASIKADRAQIENARLQLDYARIRSPIDGVTGVRLVDQGNIVHASDATGIVVVTQLDPMSVIFTLPQDDLSRVGKALAAGPVAVDAYSRDGATKLSTGELLVVDNQVNQTTATMRLKANFPNPNRALWPNVFVKARLLLETLRGVTVVPAVALQRGQQGTYVYVVGPDQTANVRPVEVTSVDSQLAIIAQGINPGEQVVVEGQNQLRPGAKVTIRSPDGASSAGGRPAGSSSAGPGARPRPRTSEGRPPAP